MGSGKQRVFTAGRHRRGLCLVGHSVRRQPLRLLPALRALGSRERAETAAALPAAGAAVRALLRGRRLTAACQPA